MSVLIQSNLAEESRELLSLEKDLEVLRLQKRSLLVKNEGIAKKNKAIENVCSNLTKNNQTERESTKKLAMQKEKLLAALNQKQQVLQVY